MSRAAQVCWNWKYLTEHDELWVGKCMKRGWYLPYTPSNNENAAWKMHYICCISTLDMDGPVSKSKQIVKIREKDNIDVNLD